jgi:nucleoside diphosphate kinase
MNEITLGFVKPDAYQYRKEILEEFILPIGLSIILEKDPYFFTEEIARRHYREHRKKKRIFEKITLFTVYGIPGLDASRQEKTRLPSALYVFEGDGALERLRQITGPTDPATARVMATKTGIKTGIPTIRSKYGIGMPDNAFHSADSYKSVRREIMLHFRREELPKYVLEMLDKKPYV